MSAASLSDRYPPGGYDRTGTSGKRVYERVPMERRYIGWLALAADVLLPARSPASQVGSPGQFFHSSEQRSPATGFERERRPRWTLSPCTSDASSGVPRTGYRPNHQPAATGNGRANHCGNTRLEMGPVHRRLFALARCSSMPAGLCRPPTDKFCGEVRCTCFGTECPAPFPPRPDRLVGPSAGLRACWRFDGLLGR